MSMNERAKWVLTVAAAVALLALPAGASLAQDPEPEPQPDDQPASPSLKLGMVDLDVISEQYQELIARQDELRSWAQARARYIDQLRNYLFLSEQNFAEVAELLQTPRDKWTEAQVTREEELRKVSEEKEKRMMDLQAKTDRTPAEGDEFNSLSDTYEARRNDITTRAAAIEQEYLDRRAEAQMALVSSVRDIITEVAQDEQYDLILDSAMVFYSSDQITDLTTLVLEKLNTPPEG